jgi:multimeric flavodoxin WrbA
MKVIAVNGSPHEKGNTYTALCIAKQELEAQGIEVEVLQLGKLEFAGCRGCGACSKTGQCVFADDVFNEMCAKFYEADGVILGSPVYYASMNGTLKCFLDRCFYQSKGRMRHKVAAAIAVSRRAGDMTTLDDLQKYFLISEMVIAPSYYWNVIHGAKPGEVLEDKEGVSVVANMARNMAWLLKMKEATKDTVEVPEKYPREWTNFIR